MLIGVVSYNCESKFANLLCVINRLSNILGVKLKILRVELLGMAHQVIQFKLKLMDIKILTTLAAEIHYTNVKM